MARGCTCNSVMRLLILACVLLASVRSKDCVLKDECSCAFDDGSGTVDLTSLGHTDNTPAFKDVLCNDEGYYYSYNPCGGFTEDQCQDATSCVLNEDKSESQQIGDVGRAAFKYDDDTSNVLVAYTSGKGVLKLTQVTLQCDQTACDPVMTAQGEQNPGQFLLTLTTICACPGACTASGPRHCNPSGGGASGISGGSIFLIICFTLLIIYFVTGTLLSKYVRKKEGKEVIPNYMFWRSLPVLIKTGILFSLGMCIPRLKKTSYSEI